MIRLLLDQGLPRRVAKDLDDSGWDVAHVGGRGMSNATDASILSHARDENRTVVTLDSDFAKILAFEKSSTPSVIHLRIDRLNRSRTTALLRTILPEIISEIDGGAIVTVTKNGIRIRRLPLP